MMVKKSNYQGVAASDQDILKFIKNLSDKKYIKQASLSSMKLPRKSATGITMKGFRVFVLIDPKGQAKLKNKNGLKKYRFEKYQD